MIRIEIEAVRVIALWILGRKWRGMGFERSYTTANTDARTSTDNNSARTSTDNNISNTIDTRTHTSTHTIANSKSQSRCTYNRNLDYNRYGSWHHR